MATTSTTFYETMARRTKQNGDENEVGSEGMEKERGVNILTNTDFGVYIEGAEKTIEMYEKGEISREDLYATILDLDVVYKSKEGEISPPG
jgi:hypothetical protein